jgi:hypothetical protein
MRFTFHNEKPIENTLNQDNLYLTIASKIMIDLNTPGKKLSLLGILTLELRFQYSEI